MAKQGIIMAKFLLAMMFKKDVNISETNKTLQKFADVKIACILNIKSVVMAFVNIGTQIIKTHLYLI